MALLRKSGRSRRVVLLEDDVDIARLISVQIVAAGHVCVGVYLNGFGRLLEPSTPLWDDAEVVVTDLLLGGEITGIDVLAFLKEHRPGVFRIVNSAVTFPYEEQLGRLAEVVLQKGHHGAKDLDAAIRSADRRRRDGG